MKSFSLLLCFFLLWINSIAQSICGFDRILDQRLKDDPKFAAKVNAFHQDLVQKKTSNFRLGTTNNTIDTIPLVIHVVNTGDSIGSIYNPTDQQIIDAIKYLNEVYAGIIPFAGGVKEMNIRFVLAKRDTLCNPTNGIIRVNGAVVNGYVSGGVAVPFSGAVGVQELQVKNLSRWDPSLYYNIWVVNRLNGADGTVRVHHARQSPCRPQ
jgi:hypothetical protein